MRKHSRWICSLAGFSLGLAAPAAAQSSGTPPIEIGLDAVLAHRSTNFDGPGPSTSSETFVQLPAGQIRVGFLLNQTIELEPALGLNYIGGDGGHTTTANLVIGLPINLQPDFSKPNWYVRPLVGFEHFSGSTGSSSTSATQVSFGAGVGLRLPIDRRFAGRFEANYTHGNESDIFGSYNQFGLLAGLSFYTR